MQLNLGVTLIVSCSRIQGAVHSVVSRNGAMLSEWNFTAAYADWLLGFWKSRAPYNMMPGHWYYSISEERWLSVYTTLRIYHTLVSFSESKINACKELPRVIWVTNDSESICVCARSVCLCGSDCYFTSYIYVLRRPFSNRIWQARTPG